MFSPMTIEKPASDEPWNSEEAVRLKTAFEDFGSVVHSAYGSYLDGCLGFRMIRQTIEEGHRQLRASGQVPAGSDLDAAAFLYSRTDPSKGGPVQHGVSQGEMKRRNAARGENEVRLAHMLLVFVYEAWETEHRHKVAEAIRTDAKDVKIPVLGDLRLLRHTILHGRGVLSEETVRKLEVLRVGKAGDRLILDDKQVESIVMTSLMDSITNWLRNHFEVNDGGDDDSPSS